MSTWLLNLLWIVFLLLLFVAIPLIRSNDEIAFEKFHKLKFQFHSTFLLSVLFSIADMSKPNENYALSLSINEWHKNEMEWQYSNQAFHVMDGAWNLPIGRLYTQTARLAHFAFSNSWCTSAMEFNAIWWDFLHVPLCTTHIQHELNKSNQLLVRRVPFSIFAVVSCWNGECDSDTFTLCALLSVELSQAECRLYANLAYAVHRKPIYMQPILHGNDYGCNQAFLSRKKREHFHTETIKFSIEIIYGMCGELRNFPLSITVCERVKNMVVKCWHDMGEWHSSLLSCEHLLVFVKWGNKRRHSVSHSVFFCREYPENTCFWM